MLRKLWRILTVLVLVIVWLIPSSVVHADYIADCVDGASHAGFSVVGSSLAQPTTTTWIGQSFRTPSNLYNKAEAIHVYIYQNGVAGTGDITVELHRADPNTHFPTTPVAVLRSASRTYSSLSTNPQPPTPPGSNFCTDSASHSTLIYTFSTGYIMAPGQLYVIVVKRTGTGGVAQWAGQANTAGDTTDYDSSIKAIRSTNSGTTWNELKLNGGVCGASCVPIDMIFQVQNDGDGTPPEHTVPVKGVEKWIKDLLLDLGIEDEGGLFLVGFLMIGMFAFLVIRNKGPGIVMVGISFLGIIFGVDWNLIPEWFLLLAFMILGLGFIFMIAMGRKGNEEQG